MASGNIYTKCDESNRQLLKEQEAEMSSGRAGFVQVVRGLDLLTLYVVHAVSFMLWAALLAVVIAKYSEMSKELEQMRAGQSMLRSNGSETAKQVEMLQLNQSTMNSSGAELARDLKRLQSDQATLKQEVSQNMAKAKSDRDYIRAEAYKILDIFKKENDSTCSICPAGWLLNVGNCYFFSTAHQHWSYAKQACKDQEAQFIVIETQQEQEFLTKNTNGNDYWIGLHDMSNEGTFNWVDDTSVTYSNWKEGEPNNYGRGEDCVMALQDGKWNDAPCVNKNGWICEKKWTC